MSEVEDAVEDILDKAAFEPLQEEAREGGKPATSREQWIALASCILAVVSAIAGLFASFYSDRAQDRLNDAAIAATERANRIAEASFLELRSELLSFEHQGIPADLLTRIDAARQEAQQSERDLQLARVTNARLDARHDHLATAVTLFQVAIVLSSIAVLMGSNTPLLIAALATGGGLISALRLLWGG